MVNKTRLLPIYILQFIPIILFPLDTLRSGLPIVGLVLLLFLLLGYGLWRGKSWGHSMSIFMQGFNIIIRLMMLFPHAGSLSEGWNIQYIVINIISIIISGWFLLRLDRTDIRATITA